MNKTIKEIMLITLIATMLVAPSMALMQAHASVPPLLDLRGTWTFNYHFPYENPTLYAHTMMITSFNPTTGVFSGTGYYNANHLLNWTITGTETYNPESEIQIDVVFHIAYNQSSYFVDATGHASSNVFMWGDANGWNSPEDNQGPAYWDAEKINLSPDPNVQLTFPQDSDVQSVDVHQGQFPVLPGAIGQTYDITAYTSTGQKYTGPVTIVLTYNPAGLSQSQQQNLHIAQFDFLVGDINKDGKVNGQDISLIANAMNSKPGDKKWNPVCDLNNDGKITPLDLHIAQDNMGKTAHWINLDTHIDLITHTATAYPIIDSGFGIH